jgi:hypothetical protein
MAMPKFPDADKKPKNWKDSLYGTTPVFLTIVATVLAGLSSGEMTRAQYYRSMAAQHQAKAADQWGFFQAKRLRATEAQSTLDLLHAASHPSQMDPATLGGASQRLAQAMATAASEPSLARKLQPLADKSAALDRDLQATLNDPASASAFAAPESAWGSLQDQGISDKDILSAMNAINAHQSEAAMAPLLKRITGKAMADSHGVIDANTEALDRVSKGPGAVLDKLHGIFSGQCDLASEAVRVVSLAPLGGDRPSTSQGANPIVLAQREIDAAFADIAAARFRYAAARYEREARYNSMTGQLCEVEVHQTSVTSERHRTRSAQFFYGMLAAQAGVTIATLALAVQRRSIFWSFGAAAGIAAIGFSAYVYLLM